MRKVFHLWIPSLFFLKKKAKSFVFMLPNRYCRTKLLKMAENEAISTLEMTHNNKMRLNYCVGHASYTSGVSIFDVYIFWHILSPYHSSLNFFKKFSRTSNLALKALFLRQHLTKMMKNVDLQLLTVRDNFNFKNWCGFSCYVDQLFFARAKSHQEGVRLPKVILILFFFKQNCFSCPECKSFIYIQIPSKIAWNQGLFHLNETECSKQKI